MHRNRNYRGVSFRDRMDKERKRESIRGLDGSCEGGNESFAGLPRKRSKFDEGGNFGYCCRDGIDRLFLVVDRLETVFKMKDGEGLHKFYTYIDRLSEIFGSIDKIDKSKHDPCKSPSVHEENSNNLHALAQELIEAGELNEEQLLIFKKFGICHDSTLKKSDLSDSFESLSISSDSKVSEQDKIILNKDSVLIEKSTFLSLMPATLHFFDSSKGLHLVKLKSDSSQKKILIDKVVN